MTLPAPHPFNTQAVGGVWREKALEAAKSCRILSADEEMQIILQAAWETLFDEDMLALQAIKNGLIVQGSMIYSPTFYKIVATGA